MKLAYSPTFHLRLLVLCLSITAFSLFIVNAQHGAEYAIPSIVFIAFAILRNLVVLYYHVAGHCLIRIRIEFVGRTGTQNPRGAETNNRFPSWFSQRLLQFIV